MSNKKKRSIDALRRRNALIYKRYNELREQHKPYTLSVKEVSQTLADEFYINHFNTVIVIIKQVEQSIKNNRYQQEFGCYL